jgi:hypothetical protein
MAKPNDDKSRLRRLVDELTSDPGNHGKQGGGLLR